MGFPQLSCVAGRKNENAESLSCTVANSERNKPNVRPGEKVGVPISGIPPVRFLAGGWGRSFARRPNRRPQSGDFRAGRLLADRALALIDRRGNRDELHLLRCARQEMASALLG